MEHKHKHRENSGECKFLSCCELVDYILDNLPQQRMNEINQHISVCSICWRDTPHYKWPQVCLIENQPLSAVA